MYNIKMYKQAKVCIDKNQSLKGEGSMLIPIDIYNNINVTYSDKIAKISNDEELLSSLKNCGAISIAKKIKSYYENIYNRKLNIEENSIAVEIIGHVFFDRVCKTILNSSISFKLIKNICKLIVVKTETINCGESVVDNNRWFWDGVAGVDFLANAIIYRI